MPSQQFKAPKFKNAKQLEAEAKAKLLKAGILRQCAGCGAFSDKAKIGKSEAECEICVDKAKKAEVRAIQEAVEFEIGDEHYQELDHGEWA